MSGEETPVQNASVDDEPPGSPPRRRRAFLVVALVAVVVVVIVAALRLAGGDDGSTSPDQASDGGDSVPTPPASAPGRGSYIESAVAADGTVSVQQWIRSSTQIRDLSVSVYDPADSASAKAVDVKVQSLDGRVLAQKDSVGSKSVNLKLSTAVPNLYLSYQITDAVDDASQTVQGRMLAAVLGMDVTYSGSSGGVQRLVTGPGTVSNVACLRINGSADAAPKPCGSPTADGGWLVDLRGIDRSDRLLAQVESPAPGSSSTSSSQPSSS